MVFFRCRSARRARSEECQSLLIDSRLWEIIGKKLSRLLSRTWNCKSEWTWRENVLKSRWVLGILIHRITDHLWCYCFHYKTSEFTTEKTSLQKGTDFLKAFMLGFDLNDAIALLRLDDLYIESFEIKDGESNNI
jgi:hypothetical protein